MKYLRLFEQFENKKIDKFSLLFPIDADRKDKDAIFRVQKIYSMKNPDAIMLTKAKWLPNSSGSNAWTIKEWNGEKDMSETGILKYFDIINNSEFKAIVYASNLASYEKEALIDKHTTK